MPSASALLGWITAVIRRHRQKAGDINFIFCNDAYLKRMNTKYLDHRTYTDILTFDSSGGDGRISGDIFISVDRVRSNAGEYKSGFRDELHRVMIYGVLHLLGFDDATEAGKKRMRRLEEECLAMRRYI